MEDLSRFETSDAYNELQKDVLRYAEQVTRAIRADDTLVARLRQRLSDQELVELTMTIGLANLTNRIAEALKLELP
jgi:alkylhydroperoxidase family enzyme